jgi:hypothetical protein
MQYSLDGALARPTAAYRADMGEDLCSTERAAELRRMTSEACLPSLRAGVGAEWGAGLTLMAAAEANWLEQMRLSREFDRAEKAALARPREHYCEIADQWQAWPCRHSSCKPEDRILQFPAPDLGAEASSPGTPFPAPTRWATWRHYAAGCLLWPALVGFGGLAFCALALVMLVLAFGGEDV